MTGAKTVHLEEESDETTDVKPSKAQKKTRGKKTEDSVNAEPNVDAPKGVCIDSHI